MIDHIMKDPIGNLSKLRSSKDIVDLATDNVMTIANYAIGPKGAVKTDLEFKAAIGLTIALSEIRNKKRKLPLECAVRCCDVFGVNYKWMFTGEGDIFTIEEYAIRTQHLEKRVLALEKRLGVKGA